MDTSSLLFSNTDLLNLIWPLIIEQLLNITLGIADIMMVASLGEAAVSGVSLVDAVMVLVIQVFAALGTGGAVVASQYVGKKDEKLAGETAKQLLYSLIIISVFLVVLGFLSRSWILSVIFGSIEADVYAASQKYFVWTLFSLPGIALYSGCAALFRAQGNSYVSMLISVLINILNISGNAFFLFRLHWGVEGVALPTLISRLIAASVLIVLLYGAKEYHGRTAVSIKGVGHVRLNFRIIRKILYVGIPSGLENGVFQIGKILVLSIVSSYGTSAIAANAGGNTMAMLETLPGSACGLAILTVVGQCIGAGRQKEAVYFTKKITATAYVSVFIINIPILLFCSKILSFYGMSQETTRLAWLMSVSHSCFSIFIWPLAFAFPNALRAAGDTAYTMTVSILSMWILRIGFSYVFKWTGIFGLVEFMNWPASFGALCVWYAMILDWLMRSFLFVRRFSKGKWKERKLI
ncbi:MATE family efflux transporter [Treponema parvum]|uniref:Multidrug-efflux transporter n=1 Tax=Treponema parvum TaxID=138851 RepID=A0A975F270_9SPIR|nr:MATE family efflux transporter [Treponema parvum]